MDFDAVRRPLPVPGTVVDGDANPVRSRRVFIPLTDELLYERPELITGPLVPYQVDRPCFHWLSIEIEAVEVPGEYHPQPGNKPAVAEVRDAA